MESDLHLGFKETSSSDVFGEGNYKLVPWISWDDWNFVRESLFSSSPTSIDSALRRISAWRSRGCVPVTIEVTASVVEIRQKDSFFRDGLSGSDLLAEDMLTMLYCMSIMRFVNGIVEKTRKKNDISIGQAADDFRIPRMLIDIRHECSHRDIPSLRLLRLASTKVLDWLKAYYWEPQRMAIPHPSDRAANFGKEIKSRIRELAFSLDVKQATPPDSSSTKRKRIKHYEHICGRSKFLSLTAKHICGRSKFLSLTATKIKSSKSSGSKKHINKALKNVVKLYSSFPSEVVSILLEFLIKVEKSADSENSSQVSDLRTYNNSQLDDWKPVIMKLSNKDPDMLLSLLKEVVHMIETRDALQQETGEHLKSKHESRFQQTEHLSYLFNWLVGTLNDLKPSRKGKSLPRPTLIRLLRKCLTVYLLGNNNHLARAALVLAHAAGNYTLATKLSKLASSLTTSNTEVTEPDTDTETETSHVDPERFYDEEQMLINRAAEKLEVLKQSVSRRTRNGDFGKRAIGEIGRRWRVVKSWKGCPIGMLPCDVGSSGVVPVLEVVVDGEDEEKVEEKRMCGKREADLPLMEVDDAGFKRVRGCEEEDGLVFEGVKKQLMIGGLWKRVTEDEVMKMASCIRILV